jgi:uncharacterized protein (UPF0335 family)
MSEIGHNSGLDERQQQALLNIIERAEEKETERKEIAEEVKEIIAEAKAYHLDPKIVRKIIQMRAQDADKRRLDEQLLEIYKRAVGLT